MATYLSRTPASAGNRKIYLWSGWVKRNLVNGTQQDLMAVSNATNDFGIFYFDGNESLTLNLTDSGSYSGLITTNRKFRDVSAWYHIVLAVDTTQATASDRVKIYVNGVQETSFSQATYPSQNYEGLINTGLRMDISGQGSAFSGGTNSFFGSMSHIHFIDGTAYDATAFGEYDANGVWTIKTSPSVTYGTNGFFILKDGNSVTDQSGNGNNFTVGGGTLTKTEDSPSNVFATMNPLLYRLSSGSIPLSNGNNTGTPNDGTTAQVTTSTLAVNNGKYYAEFKVLGINTLMDIGILSLDNWNQQDFPFSTANVGYSYRNSGEKRSFAGGAETYGDSFTTGDIIGVAFDNTNGTLIFYKNGVSQGTAFTGLTSNLSFAFCCSGVTGNNFSTNFGNGYFGSTQISSAGTNASGIGIFEYDVPTGYTALSTKGLNL